MDPGPMPLTSLHWILCTWLWPKNVDKAHACLQRFPTYVWRVWYDMYVLRSCIVSHISAFYGIYLPVFAFFKMCLHFLIDIFWDEKNSFHSKPPPICPTVWLWWTIAELSIMKSCKKEIVCLSDLVCPDSEQGGSWTKDSSDNKQTS